MYYLNSRYYNPSWGRFINADGIIGANQDILGYNLYAYVSNNPINSFDVEGQWKLPNWAKVAIGVAVIGGLAIATALTGGATSVVLGAALTGAVYGGVSGAVTGALTGGVTGGTEGAVNGAVDGFLTGTLTGGLIGGAVSGIGIASGAVEVIGTAQKTGTAFHDFASKVEAGKLSMNPLKYSKITMNRSLSTAGLNGRKLPDVIGTARYGKNMLVEVVSKSQTAQQMNDKCLKMVKYNPKSNYSVVSWVANIGKVLKW